MRSPTDKDPSFLLRPSGAALALFLLAVVLYANTLRNGFVFDDLHQVLEDERIRSFARIPEIFTSGVWSFKYARSSYYRPMMHISYLLTYQVVGLVPWAFHLVNTLLHALTTVAVFFLALKLLRSRRGGELALGGAAAAALVFAVHPVHTEAVAWVGAVPDLLLALFYVLACLLYLSAVDGSKAAYTGALLSGSLALLSKEPAVTLPALLLLIDLFWTRAREPGRTAIRLAPFAFTTAIYLFGRRWALGGVAPPGIHTELSLAEEWMTALHYLGQYVLKCFWPFPLNALYEFRPVLSPLEPRFLASLALCAGLALLVLRLRSDRTAVVAAGLFVFPLLPSLYIPGVGEGGIAERYLYLPTVGFSLLAGICWMTLRRRAGASWAPVLVLAGLILASSFATISRNTVWRSEEALWTDTVPKSPASAAAREFLAYAHFSAGRYEESVAENLEALRLDPGRANARINLAATYCALGRLEEAGEEYRAVLVQRPHSHEAHAGIGYVYAATGRLEEALTSYREAVALAPDDAYARNGLGMVLAELGDLRSAEREFASAVSLSAGNPEYITNLQKVRHLIGSER